MEYRILGPLEARSNGTSLDLGPPKQRSLLALLLVHAEQVVSTDTIVDSLWGGTPPASAAHSIQVYVSNLRKVLSPEAIETLAPGYVFHLGSADLDSTRLERLITEADRHFDAGRPGEALELLEQSHDLWHGPALSEFRYEQFAHGEAERLDQLHLVGEELSCRALLALDRTAEALPRLRSLVSTHPLHDGYVELLMTALARVGHQSEALRLFASHRRRLAEELGIEPSQQLSDLEEGILLQDPDLQPARAHSRSPTPSPGPELLARNPYRGLRPFGEEDAENFFGRERLLDQLVRGLSGQERMLGVVGPSGAGKSSAVRAGLVPRLRSGAIPGSESWNYAVMLPSTHPFIQLEAALHRATEDRGGQATNDLFTDGDQGILRAVLRIQSENHPATLLVIDQLEELFTLTTDEDERARFLRSLAVALGDPHSGLRIAATLRGDFYDEPLVVPEFGSLFAQNLVTVVPFTPEEYQAAAIGPAENVGATIEPSLLTNLVADVIAQPGALPLFEYTLTELFETREGKTLRLASYRQMGGLKGALAGRAELAFMGLSEEEQLTARQLLLRLVARSPSGEITRRRVPRSEIEDLGLDHKSVDHVMRSFARHGLLTFDLDAAHAERTIEISHDALLREWPRLTQTIAEVEEDLIHHNSLTTSVREWVAASRDPDYLLSGGRLARYTNWVDASPIQLTAAEQQFLELSSAGEEQREEARSAAEARRHTLERQSRNRLRALIGIISLLTIAIALVVVGSFINQPPRIVILHEGEDAGFAELSLLGGQRAAREFDVPVDYVLALTGYEDKLRELADAGFEVVVTTGGNFAPALQEVAPEYPGVTFTIHDAVVDLPNVVSLLYAEEEGSYLAGAAAALTSTTGTIGFVGGMPVPLIEKFRAGYEAGARAIDPDIEILTSWLATTWDPAATAFWRPDLGRRAAEAQYDDGADVIYHAAGQSGKGVIQAAVAESSPSQTLWVIGVDVDEFVIATDEEKPHILTSMIKRMDIGVYETIRSAIDGDLEPGVVTHDLASGGVSLSESGGLSPEHRSIIDGLASAIAAGEVEVPELPETALVLPLAEPDATAEATVVFDGENCVFDGPTSLEQDDVLRVLFDNRSDMGTVLSLMALEEPAGSPTGGPSNEPPPEARWDLSALVTVGPESTGIVVLEPRFTGYEVACVTEEWAYPAGFITITTP